ncbi:acyl-CoA dehydrogenase family protein [Sphingomonas canadensis]|uniref:Acyl-CoA dehydrogenase family protein n=1 Tax=Sphingomonas canadensis TaxID=1219257 RepID=A0ABW3HCG7_9SPHN|nr:acyl-CoA dehydrogenase family protein [Sphingomonas canadensis]MCW3836999.1 acyl-CoA dehydrogenase family protein [Sphingomonas canadensis]
MELTKIGGTDIKRPSTFEEVRARIDAVLPALAEQAGACDEMGQLTPAVYELLRDSGIVRVFQPRDHGGIEGDPAEFARLIMDICAEAPSAGWCSGVVGVHSFEFAQADPRLQEEVWGANVDTWTASPYAMLGRAKRVEGGWRFTGRWPFSSGTDWCDWVVVGGLAEAADGSRPGEFVEVNHFVMPRSDYVIHQDSWDTMGLRGTGSKDVEAVDVFVPDYRVINVRKLNERGYYRENRPNSRLYEMPFDFVFPGVISAATIGLAEGVVRRFREYSENRVNRGGIKSIDNPYQMAALGAALADIAASRLHLLDDMRRAYDVALSGGHVTLEMQHEARRNQVRAVRRAAEAAHSVFSNVGGNVARNSNPIQRFYRDMSTAMCHACNVDQPVYAAQASFLFGKPIPPGIIV